VYVDPHSPEPILLWIHAKREESAHILGRLSCIEGYCEKEANGSRMRSKRQNLGIWMYYQSKLRHSTYDFPLIGKVIQLCSYKDLLLISSKKVVVIDNFGVVVNRFIFC